MRHMLDAWCYFPTFSLMVQTFLMLLTATNKYKTTDNLFSTENYINGTYAQYFVSFFAYVSDHRRKF